MKIGDEVYVHGYVDEIRSDVVIIRNDGGYFGTVPSEVNCSEKPNNCETCRNWDTVNDHCYFIQECRYEPKTKPQLTAKCLNCANSGSYKCTKCDGEMYFKTEPQTSGVVWTEDAIKNEPKSYTTWASTDEPQTDCRKCKHYTHCYIYECTDYSHYEPKKNCNTCKHDLWHTPRMCGKCVRQEDGTPSMYEPKDEPQTEDAYAYDEDDWYDKAEREGE